jgi:hypothetical protein
MVVVPALIRGSLVTTPVSAGEYDDSKPANTGLPTNQISRSVGANVTYGTSLRTKSSAEDGDWVRASNTMTF